jgi:hypothetical protein
MSGGTARQPASEPRREPGLRARGRSDKNDDQVAEAADEFFREQRSIGRYERLQTARKSSGELFERLHEQNMAEGWSTYLLPAAEHMLEALSQLNGDDEFWTELEVAESALSALSRQEVITVQEILNSDLVTLLDLMAYQPPPPSDEIAIELQVAVNDVISEPNRSRRAERSRTARYHLALFTYHLRPLVVAAREADPQTQTGAGVGRRLLTALRKGAPVLVPAAIAAGAIGVLFPPAGVGAGAAVVTHGMSEAAKELTKKSIEGGSTALLATALGNQETSADAEETFELTERFFIRAMADVNHVAQLLRTAQAEPVEPGLTLAKAHCVTALRWYFQLERVRAELSPRPGMLKERIHAEEALRALREFSDWLNRPTDYELLPELCDLLAEAFERNDVLRW